MDYTKVAVFVCAGACLAGSLKIFKPGYDIYVVMMVCIFVMFFIITKLQIVVELIEKLEKCIEADREYVKIMLKIVGISYVTQFASDMCKDCGYATMGNQIQIFGKISVLVVSLPVITSLTELIMVML